MGRALALGDSTLAAPRSWAWWICQSSGDDLEVLARGGSQIADVLRDQVPQARGRYDRVYCSIGSNDVGFDDWDPSRFRLMLKAVVDALTQRVNVLVMPTLPTTLRHPSCSGSARVARSRSVSASSIIRTMPGVVCVPTDDLTSRRHVEADLLHFTDAGQAEVADRAARLLGETVRPSTTRAVLPGPSAFEYWSVRARAQAGRTARRVGLR